MVLHLSAAPGLELVAEEHERDREDAIDSAADDVGGDQPHGGRAPPRSAGATREAGATATVGGDRDGLFFPATVLRDVTPGMAAWNQEIFGPVAPVVPFSTDQEAVALANDAELGLTAAIQSASPEHAWALGEQLHVGMVHVNDQTVNDQPNAPFSGFGASGNGIAFGGPANREAFTEWQWFTSRQQVGQFPF